MSLSSLREQIRIKEAGFLVLTHKNTDPIIIGTIIKVQLITFYWLFERNGNNVTVAANEVILITLIALKIKNCLNRQCWPVISGNGPQ